MKFGFVTCVQLGLSCMQEIYINNYKLDLAVTLYDDLQKDKSGRVYLDDFCSKKNIYLIKCHNVNNQNVIDEILNHQINWLFIIGWSQIAKNKLLDAPSHGVLGMHPTLLPVGRGRASIPWTIIKGLTKSGVTLFKLNEGVDTGPILDQVVLNVASNETATSLYNRISEAHRALIQKVWKKLVNDRILPVEQDQKKATVWEGRRPEDGQIFPSMSGNEADKQIRGVTKPYPGAFVLCKGVKYIIWEALIVYENLNSKFRIEEDILKYRILDGFIKSKNWEKKL